MTQSEGAQEFVYMPFLEGSECDGIDHLVIAKDDTVMKEFMPCPITGGGTIWLVCKIRVVVRAHEVPSHWLGIIWLQLIV